MTEAEWNVGSNIKQMLDFVKDERKKRLFACACVRKIWHLLTDDRSKQAVIVAEQYADGLVSKEKLFEAREAAWSAYSAAYSVDATYRNSIPPLAAAYSADTWTSLASTIVSCVTIVGEYKDSKLLLKDIYDPFGKYKQPRCDNYTKEFARTIYDNPNERGELLDLGILADMLIDQNVDQVLVDHLRSGTHVRGCQVIDLILGK